MDTSILEDLGLSKGEIKVYLTLLELGTTKVGMVIEKSGMASSAVHNSVNTLIEKGLVSYIKKGKIKFYKAVPPKQLVSFIEDKKKKVMEILPQLELKQKLAKEKQSAEIFEGIKGITTMLNILIEDVKKGDEYLFFASKYREHTKEIQKFFSKYDLKRKEKRLVVKGLAPKELETIFKELFKKRKNFTVKYPDFPVLTNISMCKDKIAFFSWEEKPVGYLIESEQIVEIFRNFFNALWERF